MKLSVQERHKGKKNKMEKKRIILASGSPRRKELLLQIGIVPEIIVSHVEEKITSDEPSGVVMSLAEQKAVDVAEDMPEGAVVLGSDTVVAADGKILGKPKSHVAIALSLDSSKSLSPLLRVGDRVNVMAVVSDGATSSAETVCANVKIIALDSALSGSPDAGYSLVTLDVTEDQAAAIVANPNVTLTAIPQTAEGASDAE